VLAGSPEDLTKDCLNTPNCRAVVYLPNGWMGVNSGQPVGILKNNVSNDNWALGLNSVLLLREGEAEQPSSVSSSSLSAGAIAGIAVGACAAVAAAAAGAWLLVQRRRQARPVAEAGKGGSEAAVVVAVQPSLPLHDSSYSVPQTEGSQGTPPALRSLPPTFGNAAAEAGAASSRSTLTGSSIEAAGSAVARQTALPSQVSGRQSLPNSWGAAAAGATAAAGSQLAETSTAFSDGSVSKHLSLSNGARPSPFAAMSAARSQVSAPLAPPLPQPGELSGGAGEASSRLILPELQEHIAHCDAAISYGRHMVPMGSREQLLIKQPSLLVRDELPTALQEWVVDFGDIQFLRAPSGVPLELGAGASGTVYKAKLRGETVAAKEVDLGRSLEVQQQFVREAERLHQLRHPHVVALYGVSLSGAKGYLITEYCAGRDLTSCLQLKSSGSSRRLFGWYGRGRKIAVDVAAALNFLHSRGIVHMDIKSSNVLLTGNGTAKLAGDLLRNGIWGQSCASRVAWQQLHTTLTRPILPATDVGVARLQHGTHLSYTPVVGTFAWMAPEIIIGAKCSEKVDVFSTGVTLWEIATGERPQRGSMRPPHVPEECPQEVADLIAQCMSLDPAERPSAQQLLSQLEDLASRRGPSFTAGSGSTGPSSPHAELA
jgi:hypothetical protein